MIIIGVTSVITKFGVVPTNNISRKYYKLLFTIKLLPANYGNLRRD